MRRVAPLLVTLGALGLTVTAASAARAEFDVASTLSWQQVDNRPRAST